MEFTLEFFSNDRYKILKLLYDNQIKVKDDFYAPLSQQEVADIAHFSKQKANKILNELIANRFVIYFNGKRGKYVVTDLGHKVIKLIQKNN